jgi:hypothetical protein
VREFGRLKNEWALAPLRLRRIERVQLHAELTILAKLSFALTGEGGPARGVATHVACGRLAKPKGVRGT